MSKSHNLVCAACGKPTAGQEITPGAISSMCDGCYETRSGGGKPKPPVPVVAAAVAKRAARRGAIAE